MTKKYKILIIIVSFLVLGVFNLLLVFGAHSQNFFIFLDKIKISFSIIMFYLFLLGVFLFLEGALGHLFVSHFSRDSLDSLLGISLSSSSRNELYSSNGIIRRNKIFINGILLLILVIFIGMTFLFLVNLTEGEGLDKIGLLSALIVINMMGFLFIGTLYALMNIFKDSITIHFYKEGIYIDAYKTLIPWRYFDFPPKEKFLSEKSREINFYLKNPFPEGRDKITIPNSPQLRQLLINHE